MQMRQRGKSLLLLISLTGLALGFAQAYAQARKATAVNRSTASTIPQSPWMNSKAAAPKIQVNLPAPRDATGLQNPRSPASRGRATGTTTGGAQASQVFPAGGAGNAW